MKKLLVCVSFIFLLNSVASVQEGLLVDLEEPTAAVQHVQADHDLVPQATDRPALTALDPTDAFLGKWISLEMGTTMERRGFEVMGESELGSQMQGHPPDVCDKLPPYMPFQGAFSVENLPDLLKLTGKDVKATVSKVLLSFLGRVPADHALQILIYPAVWRQERTMTPLILHRPRTDDDPVLDKKTFLSLYSDHAVNAISFYLVQLMLKKDMLALLAEMPHTTAHYIGQFLWFQSNAMPNLPNRQTVMLRFLGQEGNLFANFLGANARFYLKDVGTAEKSWKAQCDAGSPRAAMAWAKLVREQKRDIPMKEVMRAIRFAAAQGLPSAQVELGDILSQAPTRDFVNARTYWERAAVQGYGPGMIALAEALKNGKGGPKDLPRAADLFAQAASEGMDRGYYEAALLYQDFETDDGYEKARHLFHMELQIRPDNRGAVNHLAILYAEGRGGAADLDKAIDMLLPLANDRHHPEGRACHNVAAILLRKKDLKSVQSAKRYFKKGANLGDGRSAYEFARMCRDGRGGKRNCHEALKYAQKAKALGHEKAEALIASIHDTHTGDKPFQGIGEDTPLLSGTVWTMRS